MIVVPFELFAHTFAKMCRWESAFNYFQDLPDDQKAWVVKLNEYSIAAGIYQGEGCIGFYFEPEMYPYFKEFAIELDTIPEGFEKTLAEKIKLMTTKLENE